MSNNATPGSGGWAITGGAMKRSATSSISQNALPAPWNLHWSVNGVPIGGRNAPMSSCTKSYGGVGALVL
jgi:hypothetical protein